MKYNGHLHVQMNVHMNVGMSNILNAHQNVILMGLLIALFILLLL